MIFQEFTGTPPWIFCIVPLSRKFIDQKILEFDNINFFLYFQYYLYQLFIYT